MFEAWNHAVTTCCVGMLESYNLVMVFLVQDKQSAEDKIGAEQ